MPLLSSKSFRNSSYWLIDDIQTTLLKFFAAARINEIPPISIFSIISSCDLASFTVFSKGYKSTITYSIVRH